MTQEPPPALVARPIGPAGCSSASARRSRRSSTSPSSGSPASPAARASGILRSATTTCVACAQANGRVSMPALPTSSRRWSTSRQARRLAHALRRLGCKMATGSGKTVVMSMLIAWAFCNRGVNPQSQEFPNAVLVCCPNLTVKERLQVLRPEHPDNYYAAFDIVPLKYRPLLQAGRGADHQLARLCAGIGAQRRRPHLRRRQQGPGNARHSSPSACSAISLNGCRSWCSMTKDIIAGGRPRILAARLTGDEQGVRGGSAGSPRLARRAGPPQQRNARRGPRDRALCRSLRNPLLTSRAAAIPRAALSRGS